MKLNKIALAVAAALLAPAALAVPITGLVNTGAGVADNALDTRYALTVTSGSTVAGAYGYAADQVGWPDASPWIGSNGISKWLTPFADEALSLDHASNGEYTWTLKFDLTGLAGVSFSGQWAADNLGTVRLNGVDIGTSSGYGSWSTFSANSGFLAGWNTLTFVVVNQVLNGGNPTGLRVEFLETSANAIPEPESYALMLGSLGILGAVAARRRAR